MGIAAQICGGQSILQTLIKTYGDDIGKFIAIQKVKQFLDTKITQLKNAITGQSDTLLNTTNTQIDGKKTQLTDSFNKYKSDIDKAVPGGISTLQQIKGQSIQDMLGVNTFMKKFDDLKTTVNTKFTDQKSKAFNTIDQNAKQQKDKLTSQRPSVPLYDQLPERQKQMVFQQGQKVFSDQIKKNQDTLIQQMGDKLNPQTYLNNFTGALPTGSLDGILGNATSQFDSVSKVLTSGNKVTGFVKSLF